MDPADRSDNNENERDEPAGRPAAAAREPIAAAREPKEVCFLIDARGAVLWSDTGTSAVAIPDSRARWEAIWIRRDELVEIAHSHPIGPLAFSSEDETTMEALTSALGRPLRFSVVAPAGMLARQDGEDRRVGDEPWWAGLLRLASGMSDPPRSEE